MTICNIYLTKIHTVSKLKVIDLKETRFKKTNQATLDTIRLDHDESLLHFCLFDVCSSMVCGLAISSTRHFGEKTEKGYLYGNGSVALYTVNPNCSMEYSRVFFFRYCFKTRTKAHRKIRQPRTHYPVIKGKCKF